jgi:hypothetical protein
LDDIGAPARRAKQAAAGGVQSKSASLGQKTCTFVDIVSIRVMVVENDFFTTKTQRTATEDFMFSS